MNIYSLIWSIILSSSILASYSYSVTRWRTKQDHVVSMIKRLSFSSQTSSMKASKRSYKQLFLKAREPATKLYLACLCSDGNMIQMEYYSFKRLKAANVLAQCCSFTNNAAKNIIFHIKNPRKRNTKPSQHIYKSWFTNKPNQVKPGFNFQISIYSYNSATLFQPQLILIAYLYSFGNGYALQINS